jgi:hypothetical protein
MGWEQERLPVHERARLDDLEARRVQVVTDELRYSQGLAPSQPTAVLVAAPGPEIGYGSNANSGLVLADEWKSAWLPVHKREALAVVKAEREKKYRQRRKLGLPLSLIQYVGTKPIYLDVVTLNVQQVVQAQPTQVLLLPTETCTFLLAQFPTTWAVPGGLYPSTSLYPSTILFPR